MQLFVLLQITFLILGPILGRNSSNTFTNTQGLALFTGRTAIIQFTVRQLYEATGHCFIFDIKKRQ